MEAFKLAMKKNYSIEMDIHLTKDLEIIVFHDFFLGRLTSKTGFVFNKNLNYITQARLSNNEPVPTIELIKYISKSNLFNNFPLGLTTSFPTKETLAHNIKNNKIENEIISSKLQFISQDWKGIRNNRIKRLKKLDIAILSWTITSREIERMLEGLVDNITFESYEPYLRDY